MPTITVDNETYRKLKEISKKLGLPLKDTVRIIVENYHLDRVEEPGFLLPPE